MESIDLIDWISMLAMVIPSVILFFIVVIVLPLLDVSYHKESTEKILWRIVIISLIICTIAYAVFTIKNYDELLLIAG